MTGALNMKIFEKTLKYPVVRFKIYYMDKNKFVNIRSSVYKLGDLVNMI
jgi:hypothetical protein